MDNPHLSIGMDQLREPAGVIEVTASLGHRLVEKWESIQVGRQGSYSIERLDSLDHYCKSTSRTRVFCVIVFTPLPALAFALLVECLPLSSPTAGWEANWVFWIRVVLVTFAMLFAAVSALITYVPELKFTLVKRLLVCMGASGGFVGICLVVAHSIGFPLPFVWHIADLLGGLYVVVIVLLVFDGNPATCRNLRRYYRSFACGIALNIYFGIFTSLYQAVPVKCRGGMAVILPLWKFAGKHFVLWVMRDLEDFLPDIVAFTVDFFSALFISASMSSSRSLHLTAMFICVNVAQALLEFREIRGNAKTVLRLIRDRRATQRRLRTVSGLGKTELLASLVIVTNTDYPTKSLENVRLWACLPHPLTRQQVERLKVWEASGVFHIEQQSSSNKLSRAFWKSSRRIEVAPTLTTSAGNDNGTVLKRTASIARSKKIVAQGLQLLFHCEYLILVEYVECIVPLIFAIYRSVLVQLPNIVYYPAAVGNWGINAVANILVFAILEILSLLFFEVFLRRVFSFSPLYQLAFVLETQFYIVQSSLWVVILGLMQYELVHSGTDFTFRFEWLRGNNR